MPAPTTQYASRDTEEAHTNGVADDTAENAMEVENRFADVKTELGIKQAELIQLRWDRRRGYRTTTSELAEDELAMEHELASISLDVTNSFVFRLDANGAYSVRRLPELLDGICMLSVVRGWISPPRSLVDVPFAFLDIMGATGPVIRAYEYFKDRIDPSKNTGPTEPWVRHIKEAFHRALVMSWASYVSELVARLPPADATGPQTSDAINAEYK